LDHQTPMSRNAGPIFIVGGPRSGTTMVSVMLNGHPALYVSPRARGPVFAALAQRVMESYGIAGDCRSSDGQYRAVQYLRGSRNTTDLLAHLPTGKSTEVRSLLLQAMRAEAAAHGKSRWGDKCPYQVSDLPTLFSLFPDAKFLHVIRDGRSVALSQMRRQYRDIYLAIHEWKALHPAGALHGKYMGSHYSEVVYEHRSRIRAKRLRGSADSWGSSRQHVEAR